MGCTSPTRNARRILAVLPLVPVAVVAVIVIVALTPSGAWLDVHQEKEPIVSVDGAYLEAEIPIDIVSHMPYTLEGLSLNLAIFDDERGSYQTLVTSEPTDIPGNGTGTVLLRSSIFAPTLYLVIGDLVERDGSVIWLDVAAECGYLMGLADFRMTATISIPLADEGQSVDYWIAENSETSFTAAIGGLAPSLIPNDSVYRIIGGGAEIVISVSSIDDVLVVSVNSQTGLDAAAEIISGSTDLSVIGPDGQLPVDSEDVSLFLEILGFVRETA